MVNVDLKKYREIDDSKVLIHSLKSTKVLHQRVNEVIHEIHLNDLNQRIREVVTFGTYQKTEEQAYEFHFKAYGVVLDQSLRKVMDFYKLSSPIHEQETVQNQSNQLTAPLLDQDHKNKKKTGFTEMQIQIMIDALDQLKDYRLQLDQSLSKLDKDISELYHEIEVVNFNASKGYQYAKRLQTLLRQRRIVKNEISKLGGIKNLLEQTQGCLNQMETSIKGKIKRFEPYMNGWNVSSEDVIQ